MPRVTKVCRVCGQSYTACNTPSVPGVFRWQEVACSPACGQEYLNQVLAARAGVAQQEKPAAAPKRSSKRKAKVEETPVEEEIAVAESVETQGSDTEPAITGEDE